MRENTSWKYSEKLDGTWLARTSKSAAPKPVFKKYSHIVKVESGPESSRQWQSMSKNVYPLTKV